MRNTKSMRLYVSGAALLMALGVAGVAQAQTQAEDETTAVVVTGIRASARSSLAIKKNTMEVVDSITAEDIGKLPDTNVSETLTRIPGVQGYRYGGEGASPAGNGSGVTIRGLSGQTASQVNGRVFFTAGSREFNVESAIPGMVAGIDVYKNPSAEHIEGGIGGLVNIRTRNPSDFRAPTLSLGASARYNDMMQKTDPEFFALGARRWELANGGRIGALLAVTYGKSSGRSDNNPANGGANFKRAIRADDAEYTSAGAIAAGANQAYAGRSDTWFLAPVASTDNVPDASLNDYTGAALTQAQRDNILTAPALTNNQFQESIFRDRKGLSFAADYRVNDSLRFYTEYNYNYYLYTQNYRGLNAVDGSTVQNLTTTPFAYTEGFANRNSNGGSDDVVVSQRLAGATFLNSTLNTMGGDEHHDYSTSSLAVGAEWSPMAKLELKADLMYLKTQRHQDNRAVNMDSAPGLTWDITRTATGEPHQFIPVGPDLSDPANWVFRDYNNGANQKWDDSAWAAAFSGKYSPESGPLRAVKFGVRLAHQQDDYRTYNFNGKLLRINGLPVSGASAIDLLTRAPTNFMNGDTGYDGGFVVFDSNALLGDNVRNRFPDAGIPAEASLPEVTANRRYAEEDTSAAYLVGEFAFLEERLKANLGVRVVKTEGYFRAGAGATATEGDTAYTNTLPSVNISYDLTGNNDFLLRFGYGKGLTRADLGMLNPTLGYDVNVGTAGVGNPNLKPQVADSYDLSLERYFSSTNYASVALFRKEIDSFFFGITTCEVLTGLPAPVVTPCATAGQYQVTRTVNAEPGWVEGVEVAGQYFFDNLPGIWSHFGVSGTYTYVDTALPVNFGTSLAPRFVTMPQPMQSKHNYSLSGLYEDAKFSARLVYTYRSDAILFGAAVNPIDGRYIREYGILDLSLNYNLTERATVSFNAMNLTNESLNRNVGEPYGYETSLERQHYLNGRNFSLAVRYKFGG